jgi:hypothetical protein
MKYFYYDEVVFRSQTPGRYDRWHGGEWKHATGILYPSFEEYLHLREISEQEAQDLRNAGDQIRTRWLSMIGRNLVDVSSNPNRAGRNVLNLNTKRFERSKQSDRRSKDPKRTDG